MTTVFVLQRKGILHTELAGVYSTFERGREEGLSLLASEPDEWHRYEVLKVVVDDVPAQVASGARLHCPRLKEVRVWCMEWKNGDLVETGPPVEGV